MDTCHLCRAAEDLRTCEACRRPVCRACAVCWPMYAMAVRMRSAECRPCATAGARRIVREVWLLVAGVEPAPGIEL